MASNPNGEVSKAPVCGSLSLLMPVIGILADWIALKTISDPWGFGLLAVLIGITVLFTVVGAIFGVIAYVRREKFLFLPLVGLLLSAAPYVWFFLRAQYE